jgi:hypothetical protein
MGIWDSLKNFGSTIWSGIKEGANGVINVGSKIRDGVKAGYDFVKNIPVIGNLIDQGLDKVKIGGVGVKDLAGMASDGLDAATGVNNYINPKQDEAISRLPQPNAPDKMNIPDPRIEANLNNMRINAKAKGLNSTIAKGRNRKGKRV